MKTSYKKKPSYNMMLTKEQKSIIYGTLLGDGYLNKRGNNIRLQLVHGLKQEEYIRWKANKIECLLTPRGVKIETFNDKHHRELKKSCINFYTISHEYLNFLYNLLYLNGKKTLTEDNLSRLDALSLAVWLMDDGSLDRRKSKVRKDGTRIYTSARFRICTCSKDGKIEKIVCKVLKEKFDLDFTVTRHKKDYYIANCNTKNFKKLVDIVEPYFISSMKYKIDTSFLGKIIIPETLPTST